MTGFYELSHFDLHPPSGRRLSRAFCEKNRVAILERFADGDRTPVKLGMLNPANEAAVEVVEGMLRRPVERVQLNDFEIGRAIESIFDNVLDAEFVIPLDAPATVPESGAEALDHILAAAVRVGASDIHIERYPGDCDLRFRVDGILRQQFTDISPDNVESVVSRIKVLAQLDIAERRVPQDGRFACVFDDDGRARKIVFRVSIVPGLAGEDAVLRVLDAEVALLDTSELGMADEIETSFLELIANPEGMILVTGPTGSGKTTTLYSALRVASDGTRKVITAEDPIEYNLPKVNQKEVSGSMPFEVLLRALLRQDPDVMLFGEIRDRITADTAVAAATTGHVVLGTLHTSDALGVVMRLRGLELDDDDIASSLLGIVGQRLVRRLDPARRIRVEPTALQRDTFGPLIDGMELWGPDPGAGHDAYRGRCGIFELLLVDETLQEMIVRGEHKNALRTHARMNGFRTMLDDGLQKVARGITSLDEIQRIVPFREIQTSRNERIQGLR